MGAVRVGVVGATGYSGAVAARLLATHPSFELAFCTSDQRAGEQVVTALGLPHLVRDPRLAALTYTPNAEAPRLVTTVDAVVLATSAEVSAKLAPVALAAERVVIDLSGAFRLASAADYRTWYRLEHPSTDLLPLAHYGLPELFGYPVRKEGRGLLVSNPGCYPTAALLALAPLVRAGLVEARGLIVDAKSGVTGAGRQAKEEYSFGEVDEDIRAYKILTHQHTPEIMRGLSRSASLPPDAVTLTFTPHLLPVKRGILATCYARPAAKAEPRAYAECLEQAYRGSTFVEVTTPERVTLTSVVGTNRARVAVTANDDAVVAVSAIDNLLKGASGQALQTLNRIFGLEEGAGLTSLHRSAP
jgi:N-acetyl-gamma-glutamyl-phosphate reductase